METATVASTMGTAFTAVQTEFNAVVAEVAPIAIAIMGVFLVWRYGKKFFKSLAS